MTHLLACRPYCCAVAVAASSACEFNANNLPCSAPYLTNEVNLALVLCLVDSTSSVLIV